MTILNDISKIRAVDPDNMYGTIKTIPGRNDVIDLADIKEQLIVELYSK